MVKDTLQIFLYTVTNKLHSLLISNGFTTIHMQHSLSFIYNLLFHFIITSVSPNDNWQEENYLKKLFQIQIREISIHSPSRHYKLQMASTCTQQGYSILHLQLP
jgi:hypothetical protein